MRDLFLLSALVMLASGPAQAQVWITAAPGVQWRQTRAPGSDGGTFDVLTVVVDPSVCKIQVVDVYGVLKGRGNPYPAYSLREVVETLKPAVVINGGFSGSFSVPVPAGLLVSGKRVVGRLNATSRSQTGILCVQGSRVRIMRKEDYQPDTCAEAVQSGPLLVEPDGKLGINKSETQKLKYRRSAAAVDRQGRLILAATSEAYLYDLASLLVRKLDQGGVDAIGALNLSGDADSGLYLSGAKGPVTFGSQDALVASAIAVTPASEGAPRLRPSAGKRVAKPR